MRNGETLYKTRNLYAKCNNFIGLPIFGYLGAFFVKISDAGAFNPSTTVLIMAIPIALVVLLFIYYHFLSAYRKSVYRNTGQLLIDNLLYIFHIKNINGDLDEYAKFIFENPTKQNIVYLGTQFTAFSMKPEDALDIKYSANNSGNGSQVVISSPIIESEQSWDKPNDHRVVWRYDWNCELKPPLSPGNKLNVVRYYSAKGTEKDAFISTTPFSFRPELPTKKVMIKIIFPATHKLEITDIFITDEAGHSLPKYIKYLKKPVVAGNILSWELYYPLSSARYGCCYKLDDLFQ